MEKKKQIEIYKKALKVAPLYKNSGSGMCAWIADVINKYPPDKSLVNPLWTIAKKHFIHKLTSRDSSGYWFADDEYLARRKTINIRIKELEEQIKNKAKK